MRSEQLVNNKSRLRISKYSVTILLIAVLILSFCSSHAQYGIKLGMTGSSFYYPNQGPDPHLSFDIDLRPYLGYDVEWIQLGDQKPLYAPYLSIYRSFNLANRFTIQPEIGITQKGVNFSQYEFEEVIYKVKITYIDIPVSINYTWLLKEKIESKIYVGGFADIKLKAVKIVESLTANYKETLRNVNTFNFGINYGISFKFKLAEQFFLLDLRGYSGLSNAMYISDDQVPMYHEIQDVRITGINILLGYEF